MKIKCRVSHSFAVCATADGARMRSNWGYRHGDWLGSVRLQTSFTQMLVSDSAYAPFGENYAVAGSHGDVAFTQGSTESVGQLLSTSLYDFDFRKYAQAQGRWISPDPAGMAAADPTNPQSWNRYAYVLNNPLGMVDPLGLVTNCLPASDPNWVKISSTMNTNLQGTGCPIYGPPPQGCGFNQMYGGTVGGVNCGVSINVVQQGNSGGGGSANAANNGQPQKPQPQQPKEKGPTTKEKVCTAAGAALAHAGIALSPVTGGPTTVLSVTTGEEIVMDLTVAVNPWVLVGVGVVGAGAFFYCL